MTDTSVSNLDKRAQDRQKEPIQLGGQKFKRRLRSNKVMKEFRRLGREHAKAGRELTRLRKDKDLAPDDEALVEAEEAREELLYDMVANFLAPFEEGGQEPTSEFLQEHVDYEDLQELFDSLTPFEDEGENDDEGDPTPEPAETAPTSG